MMTDHEFPVVGKTNAIINSINTKIRKAYISLISKVAESW